MIERGLLRFLYGRDPVVMILLTYAVLLILEDVIKLVWGVDPYFAFQPIPARPQSGWFSHVLQL